MASVFLYSTSKAKTIVKQVTFESVYESTLIHLITLNNIT